MKKLKKVYYCCVTGKPIPEERVKALILLGIPEDRWTLVTHSLEKRRQGIYFGEAGTSALTLVDQVNNDSVRSIFRKSEAEAESDSNND